MGMPAKRIRRGNNTTARIRENARRIGSHAWRRLATIHKFTARISKH
jgi:hypothetical protein